MTNIRKLAQAAFLVSLSATIILSLLPREFIHETGKWDKLTHTLAYSVLAILVGIGFSGWRFLLLCGLGLVLLGAGLEVAQTFIPGRTASATDAFANFTGVVLGSLGGAGANACLIRSMGK